MRENKIDNSFEYALNNNQLYQFIVGKQEYFVLDREMDEHWPLGSYMQFIEPYLNGHNHVFEENFWIKLNETFDKVEDKNIFFDLIVGYLIPYYNTKDLDLLKKRNEKTPSYFINTINQFLQSNKESLQNDKRGTGVEWNSKDGLFESIKTNLNIIRERGGPDFLQKDSI